LDSGHLTYGIAVHPLALFSPLDGNLHLAVEDEIEIRIARSFHDEHRTIRQSLRNHYRCKFLCKGAIAKDGLLLTEEFHEAATTNFSLEQPDRLIFHM
jgi:hypothetical protein